MKALGILLFVLGLSSCFLPTPHDWCWGLGFGYCLADGAEAALPDRSLTPGISDPRLTKVVICAKGFSTKKYRHTTAAMKRKVCQEYHVKARCPGVAQEIDHLIALTDGGADVIENLWPQPYTPSPSAHQKDALENKLHSMVCKGQVDLPAAQACLATNWYVCYQKYER